MLRDKYTEEDFKKLAKMVKDMEPPTLCGIRYEPPSFAFGGFPIIESPYLPKGTIPVKRHIEKRWMKGRCYHARIQKKWNKRYGTKVSDDPRDKPMFVTNFGIIMTPEHSRLSSVAFA